MLQVVFEVKDRVSISDSERIGLSFTALTKIKIVAESLFINPSLVTNLNESAPKKLESGVYITFGKNL